MKVKSSSSGRNALYIVFAAFVQRVSVPLRALQ